MKRIILIFLCDKSNISNLVKNSDLKTKYATLATKSDLKELQDKIGKLQVFDSSCYCSKRYFEDDDKKLFSVSRSLYLLQKIANCKHILEWKSKEWYDDSIKPPATSNNSLAPALNYINTKLRVKIDNLFRAR